MTPDSFDAPVLLGFGARPDFVDADEERTLTDRIDATDLQLLRFQSWLLTSLLEEGRRARVVCSDALEGS